MLRSDLEAAIAAKNRHLRPSEVKRIVQILFDEVTAQLAKGGRVELRGFGTFSTRARQARQGRNPRTGAAVFVVAKRAIHFKPSKLWQRLPPLRER